MFCDADFLYLGENVEPSEIEDAALRSSLIQQIVVIGQVISPSIVVCQILLQILPWLTYSMFRTNDALELLFFLTEKRR